MREPRWRDLKKGNQLLVSTGIWLVIFASLLWVANHIAGAAESRKPIYKVCKVPEFGEVRVRKDTGQTAQEFENVCEELIKYQKRLKSM